MDEEESSDSILFNQYHKSQSQLSDSSQNSDAETSSSLAVASSGGGGFKRKHEQQTDKEQTGTNRNNNKRNNNKQKKSDPSGNKKVYCICRTSSLRFMIGCDRCSDWFHGDCVKITQDIADKLRRYYCPLCIAKDPTLEIQLEKGEALPEKWKIKYYQFSQKISQNYFADNVVEKSTSDAADKENLPTPDATPITSGGEQMSATTITTTSQQQQLFRGNESLDSDDNDNYMPTDDDDSDELSDYKSNNKQRKPTTTNRTENAKNRGRRGRPKKEEKEKKTKSRQRRKGQSVKANKDDTKGKKVRGRPRVKSGKSHVPHHRRSRYKTESDQDMDHDAKSSVPRQCYGPDCCNAARKGSKYCSDECGIALATERITTLLPQRLYDWHQSPCAADLLSMKELAAIRQERERGQEILSELNQKQAELEEILRRGKSCLPYTEEEHKQLLDNDCGDIAETINCNVCSSEVTLKSALRHFERCFNKIECRTSYSSTFKPFAFAERQLLCDAYTPSNKTYCKRLRVICPEHSSKESRIADDEVCGCPLRSDEDPFNDSTGSFCRVARKKCTQHYGWEKLRQASLDALCLKQYFKSEELSEREVKVLHAMRQRKGIVQLLLHQTIVSPDVDAATAGAAATASCDNNEEKLATVTVIDN